jgi:hypothetical protein
MDGVGALGAVFAGLASSMDLRYAFLVAAVLAAATVIMATRHAFTPMMVGVQAVNPD